MSPVGAAVASHLRFSSIRHCWRFFSFFSFFCFFWACFVLFAPAVIAALYRLVAILI